MDFFNNLPGLETINTVYVIARALITALDVVLLILFIYALRKGLKFRPHFDLEREMPKRKLITLRNAYFKDQWKKLMKRYTETPSVDTMRLAIIEADALVDTLLRDLNFPGDHLADRLSYLNNQDIKSLEGIWEAHRLRNEVVHQPSASVSIRDGMTALAKYEAFFKELEVF